MSAIDTQSIARKSTMKIKMLPISSITPYQKNPRVIPDSAVKKVADSIKEFGWNQPIVVDKNSVIIVGHTRYLAAKLLNLESVPVHVAADLTDEQVTAYRIADNRTGEESTWDDVALRDEFSKIADAAISSTSFDMEEIEKIMRTVIDHEIISSKKGENSSGSRLNSLVGCGYNITLTEAEATAWKIAAADYETANGTLFGFINKILRLEQP
jgi:hypothetical protein